MHVTIPRGQHYSRHLGIKEPSRWMCTVAENSPEARWYLRQFWTLLALTIASAISSNQEWLAFI